MIFLIQSYDYSSLAALMLRQMIDPKQQYPDTELMAAIALKESAGDPLAAHQNSNGSIDRGLWQINSIHASEFPQYPDFRIACYTPHLNAQMAIAIWQKQGYGAWSTFKVLL